MIPARGYEAVYRTNDGKEHTTAVAAWDDHGTPLIASKTGLVPANHEWANQRFLRLQTTPRPQETTMNPAAGSVLSLVPAPPGHQVLIVNKGRRENCPVIAWAVVVDRISETGQPITTISPAFLFHGLVYTSQEFRQSYGEDAVIRISHTS